MFYRIFIKKDIKIWLKLGRFVIVYDLTKWVKPFFRDFFFFFCFQPVGFNLALTTAFFINYILLRKNPFSFLRLVSKS